MRVSLDGLEGASASSSSARRIERDLDVERRDELRRAERIRAVNQSPWAIGTAFYDQRDTYTRNAEIDATGYGRGPSYHPEEGSYAYRRDTRPNDWEIPGSDASLYEKQAWPWLVYKETTGSPYFAHLREQEQKPGVVERLRRFLAHALGRRPEAEQRSDARIEADVADALWRRGAVDARDIEVHAKDGEVTLEGTVADREAKHVAGEIVRAVRGVRQVHNHLKIRHDDTIDAGLAFSPAL